MIKQSITLMILLLVLVACGGASGTGGNDNASAAAEPNTVLMNTTDFIPTSVTIPVDTHLTLKADGFVPHFIANGTWENGQPVAGIEPGAPEVNNIEIQGNSEGTIGPFSEAGTFEFYCTIHPNMNLTVTVES
jgi:plastocyanin